MSIRLRFYDYDRMPTGSDQASHSVIGVTAHNANAAPTTWNKPICLYSASGAGYSGAASSFHGLTPADQQGVGSCACPMPSSHGYPAAMGQPSLSGPCRGHAPHIQRSFSTSPGFLGDNVFHLRDRKGELLEQFQTYRYRYEEELAQAKNQCSAIKEHNIMLEQQHAHTVSVLNETDHELMVFQKERHAGNNQIASHVAVLNARADSYNRATGEYNMEIILDKSDGETWKGVHAMCEQL